MKTVYICSPLRGDIKKNIENAQEYCRQATFCGYMPIAPHIYFTQFLDDSKEDERQYGLEAGLYLLRFCDEIWVFGEPSEGMKAEIELAKILKINVVYREVMRAI